MMVKSHRIAEPCSLQCFPLLACILEINKSEGHPVFVCGTEKEEGSDPLCIVSQSRTQISQQCQSQILNIHEDVGGCPE